MDNLDLFKEILIALKSELIRYRMAVLGVSLAILFIVLGVGMTWKNQYVSRSVLEIDDSNIIKPLLRGRAEFAEADRVDEAKTLMDNKQMLEIVASRLGYIDENTDRLQANNVVKSIRGRIQVEADEVRKNFFSISYIDPMAEDAYEANSVLTEVFVQFQQQSTRAEGELAYEFISKQADAYKVRLENAEKALQEFKANSLDTNEETVQGRINKLEAEIQELELGIQESRSRIASMRAQLDSEGKYLDVQAEVFSLKKQRSALQDRLNELRLQYQESYPDIQTIKQQISKLDMEIKWISDESGLSFQRLSTSDALESNPEVLFDELRKQVAVEEVALKAQIERLGSLEKLLKEEQEKADIVVANQTKAADLMRDYTVTKDVYEEMLSRKENAELSVAIQKDGRGLTFRVVEEPSYPFYPSGLTFSHFVIAAPIFALGVPLGLLMALILLDPRVRTIAALKASFEPDVELLGVSGHYHTAFAQRVLKKDAILLGVISVLVVLSYTSIAVIGLS